MIRDTPAEGGIGLQQAGLIETAREHREAGRLVEAEALLSRVLKANPRNGRAFHQLGLTLAAAGQLQNAAICLGQASAFAPTDPDRHADLARVHEALGDAASARRHLRFAVLLGPAREDLLLRFGRLSLTADLLVEAEAWLQRAMALKRPHAEAHVVLGYTWFKAGRTSEAIRAFADAAEETPAYTLAFEALAAALRETGAPMQEVMKAARVVAERHPDQRHAVIPVMTYLRDIGEDAEARRLATGVINQQMEAAAQDEVGRFGIRVLYPDSLVARIGEFAHQLELHVKMKLLGWIPFVTILAPRPEEVVNRCFLDYWRPHITVVDDPAEIARLSPLKLRVPFDPLYVRMPNGIAMSKNRAYHMVQEEWQRQGRGALLRLTHAHAVRGREGLRRLGVPDDAWFACLHVREGGYLKEGAASQESARNANITTYLPAVEEIVRSGGWVIRMGDPSVTPLPKMANVVDYALTSERSQEMDVYLSGSCRFFLGTTSGLYLVAAAFGVPIACTNFFPPGELLGKRDDIFVPKLIRERATGRLLGFEECLSLPLALTYDSQRLDELGLQPIDNEPEDIRMLVDEMLRRLEGGTVYTPYDEALQRRWKDHITPYSSGDAGSRVAKHWLIRHRRLFSQAPERR